MDMSEKMSIPSGDEKKIHPLDEKTRSGAGGELPVTEVGSVRPIFLDSLGKELFPTPTIDPLDPLNWPNWRKYICIFIVMYMYFLFT